MRLLRRVEVTLEGPGVAKWLAQRIGAARNIDQIRHGLVLQQSGVAVLTSFNPIYKNYPPSPGEADVAYIGEDANVRLAVSGHLVASAGSNSAIIDTALNLVNSACNGLVDAADKVAVEVEHEQIDDV